MDELAGGLRPRANTMFAGTRQEPMPTDIAADIGRASAGLVQGWIGVVRPGIDPLEWTPRELRHSFVSVLSDAGVPLEAISQLVGHSGTSVTELVYRHQLRPVIQTGATVMDALFRVELEPGSTGSHVAVWSWSAVLPCQTGRGDRI